MSRSLQRREWQPPSPDRSVARQQPDHVGRPPWPAARGRFFQCADAARGRSAAPALDPGSQVRRECARPDTRAGEAGRRTEETTSDLVHPLRPRYSIRVRPTEKVRVAKEPPSIVPPTRQKAIAAWPATISISELIVSYLFAFSRARAGQDEAVHAAF